MKNRDQIHVFYKKVKMEIIIFQAITVKFHDLLGGRKLATNAKLQHNFSKLTPDKPKNTEAWGVNIKPQNTAQTDTLISYEIFIL